MATLPSDERLRELAAHCDRYCHIGGGADAELAAACRAVIAIRELLDHPPVPVQQDGYIAAWFDGVSKHDLRAILADAPARARRG